jgi:hypothetical protein
LGNCKKDLTTCKNDLDFIKTTKDGAQSSRGGCEEQVAEEKKLFKKVEEKGLWYKNKSDELTLTLNECNFGYGLANGSIELLTTAIDSVTENYELCVDSFNDTDLALSSALTQNSNLIEKLKICQNGLNNCSSFGDTLQLRATELDSLLTGKIDLIIN